MGRLDGEWRTIATIYPSDIRFISRVFAEANNDNAKVREALVKLFNPKHRVKIKKVQDILNSHKYCYWRIITTKEKR